MITPLLTAASLFLTASPATPRPASAQITRELDALYQSNLDKLQRGDVEGVLDDINFPLLLVADQQGEAGSVTVSREVWRGLVTQMAKSTPKVSPFKHHFHYTVVSDSMVLVEDLATSAKGGPPLRSGAVVIKKGGHWLYQSLLEPGALGLVQHLPGGAGASPAPADGAHAP